MEVLSRIRLSFAEAGRFYRLPTSKIRRHQTSDWATSHFLRAFSRHPNPYQYPMARMPLRAPIRGRNAVACVVAKRIQAVQGCLNVKLPGRQNQSRIRYSCASRQVWAFVRSSEASQQVWIISTEAETCLAGGLQPYEDAAMSHRCRLAASRPRQWVWGVDEADIVKLMWKYVHCRSPERSQIPVCLSVPDGACPPSTISSSIDQFQSNRLYIPEYLVPSASLWSPVICTQSVGIQDDAGRTISRWQSEIAGAFCTTYRITSLSYKLLSFRWSRSVISMIGGKVYLVLNQSALPGRAAYPSAVVVTRIIRNHSKFTLATDHQRLLISHLSLVVTWSLSRTFRRLSI